MQESIVSNDMNYDILDHNQILLAVDSVLRLNPNLTKYDVDKNFSRLKNSFFPLLANELYGKYENFGTHFAKAIKLCREIKKDAVLVEKIKSFDLNEKFVQTDNEKVIFWSEKSDSNENNVIVVLLY
jgi:hypothetical protein